METPEDEIELILNASFGVVKSRFDEVCKLWTSDFAWQPHREKIQLRLLPKLLNFLDKCLQNIQTVNTKEAIIDDCLQDDLLCIIGVVNCIGNCYGNWSSEDDILTVNVGCLFDATCEVILKTCQHYSDRKSIYKHLSDCQDRLDEMYNICTVNVINKFMCTLESWKGNFNLEKDCALLISVCEAISDICKIVGGFDVKIAISLWKLYIRLVTLHCDYIKDRLDVAKAINSLCDEVVRDVNYLDKACCQEDQKEVIKKFQQTIRLSGFFLKIIVKLCDLFKNYLGNCIENIVQLLLHVCRFSPPSLYCHKLPKIVAPDVEVQLTMAIEPLVAHLVSEREFAYSLFRLVYDPPDTFQFALCSLLVIVLDNVFSHEVGVQDLWMTFKRDESENNNGIALLDALFHTLIYCYAELSLPVYLPGVMLNGKPQRLISLYEHLCTKLCGFITCLPAKYFANLEHVLLEYLLSDNVWLAFIASDAWACLARLESTELCYHHCWHLASLATDIEMCGSVQSVMLSVLVNRMANFLDYDHKSKLLMKFHHLVSTLENEDCASNEMKMLHQNLTSKRCKLLNDVENVCQKASGDVALYDVMKSVAILQPTHNAIANKDLELMLLFWKTLPWNSLPTSLLTASALGNILNIISTALFAISSERCLQFILEVNDWMSSNCESFCISVISFVGTLGTKVFPPSNEQKPILESVAKLLCLMLEEKNVAIHQFALEIFAKFAVETVHAEIIPICMKNKHLLKPYICNYLNKICYKLDGEFDLHLEYKNRLHSLNWSTSINDQTMLHFENAVQVEQDKVEGPDHEIMSVLDNMAKEIQKLETITLPGKLTLPQQEFIQTLCTKLLLIGKNNI